MSPGSSHSLDRGSKTVDPKSTLGAEAQDRWFQRRPQLQPGGGAENGLFPILEDFWPMEYCTLDYCIRGSTASTTDTRRPARRHHFQRAVG
ncbi:hypothetical protein HPG69_001033 [Diceros bicornis minor]|uniref:Uncharacterized protein n=1 Tax=Diceros bicornis minor TaxID=77932 RepID=A0A7J7E5P6_DICBM|nr:hypothetical protein HPG69_001033 [Diceros bicornis minor]